MCVVILVIKVYLVTHSSLVRPLGNDENFTYEKLQNYGLGKRVIPNYRRLNGAYPYPQPLSSTTTAFVRSPYHSIYQGERRGSDKRIYMKRFDYMAKSSGHRVFCQAIVACKIAHLAIETEDGVPIILRGGVGYTYFQVIIKAAAGVRLQGSLKAYCRKEHVGK